MVYRLLSFLAVLLWCLPSFAASQDFTCVEATQSYAPYPCVINVLNQTGTNPWYTKDSVHDFDDCYTETWTPSGQRKGLGFGVVGAHVWKDAGSYSPTLTVWTHAGSSSEVGGVSLGVGAIDAHFPTTQTACVSTSGDFGACPFGAEEITSSDFDATLAAELTGTRRRVLFRAGETFTADATVTIASTSMHGYIGSYDSGTDPIVNVTHAGALFQLGNAGTRAADWRFVDLDLQGGGTATHAFQSSTTDIIRDILILRVNMEDFATSAVALWNSTALATLFRRIFIHDSSFVDSGEENLRLWGQDLSVQGNTFTKTGGTDDNIQFDEVVNLVFSHNTVSGTAEELVEFGESQDTNSVNLVVSHNDFIGGSGANDQIKLYRDATESGVFQNVLWEGNVHTRQGADCAVNLINHHVAGSAFRNNIFEQDNSGCDGFDSLLATTNDGVAPTNSFVAGNTCYGTGNPVDDCVNFDTGTGHSAYNNLLYSPNDGGSGDIIVDSTSATLATNVQTDTDPFAVSPPVDPEDFQLDTANGLINDGTSVAGAVFRDYADWGRDGRDICGVSIGAWSSPPPAFPGAYGHAACRSIGGRRGAVIYVTSFDDSGPGTFREAVEASGPRNVLFTQGGYIETEARLNIEDPYLTVAGQTAPGGGITLRMKPGNPTTVDGILRTQRFPTAHPADQVPHDSVFRYLRVRHGAPPGSGDRPQSIIMWSGYNMIFDHITSGWNDDNLFTFSAANNNSVDIYHYTVQNSLLHEPFAAHPTGLNLQSQLGSEFTKNYQASIHHNLFVHSGHRNPRMTTGEFSGAWNNVTYNWANRPGELTRGTITDLFANYWERGPMSNGSNLFRYEPVTSEGSYTPSIYIAENHFVGELTDPTSDNWILLENDPGSGGGPVNGAFQRFMQSTFNDHVLRHEPAIGAYETVLGTAGASARVDENGVFVWNRDSVDARVVDDVRNKTGPTSPLTSQTQVGGFPAIAAGSPVTDTDGDGMPDDFEILHGFKLNDAGDGSLDFDFDGYTNLEEYLNGTMIDTDGDGFEEALTDKCTAIYDQGIQFDSDADGYGQPCDGDFNQDGVVGAPDFITFRNCFIAGSVGPGMGPSNDPTCAESDMNSDGLIGSPDFILFRNQFIRGAPGPSCCGTFGAGGQGGFGGASQHNNHLHFEALTQ